MSELNLKLGKDLLVCEWGEFFGDDAQAVRLPSSIRVRVNVKER